MIEINFPSGIDTVFSATAPVAPARGKRWCDTTSGLVYTWTGTEWAELEGVPPQLCMGWPRSLEGSIPAGWMACDGTNGTPTQSDTGALMWIMRHGGTVATPTLTPGAGTYGSTQSVTLACATSGATIKFTTDGSTPSRSHGTTYSSAISVGSATTIKAIAYKDGMIDSAVASATYTLADTTAPTVSSRTIPSGGTTLVVVHSEIVTHGAGGSGGHTLAATGGAVTATYASGAGTNTLTFNLSRTIASGETVTHSYTQPGNGVEDAAGNDLATFSAQAVTNNSTQSGATWDSVVVADTPVGRWRLGETSGATAVDTGSASINGTYNGGFTLGQPSLVGSDTANKAVALNGTDGYVSVPTDVSNEFTGAMSLECLVKFASFPASGNSAAIIQKGYASGTGNSSYALDLSVSGSVKTLAIGCYDGSSHGASFDVSSWTTGTVYHVVGLYDGSVWKLYVNGSLVATSSATVGPRVGSRPLAFGADANSFGTGNFLNGTIDEVAIYNTALSAGRIAAHFAAL